MAISHGPGISNVRSRAKKGKPKLQLSKNRWYKQLLKRNLFERRVQWLRILQGILLSKSRFPTHNLVSHEFWYNNLHNIPAEMGASITSQLISKLKNISQFVEKDINLGLPTRTICNFDCSMRDMKRLGRNVIF